MFSLLVLRVSMPRVHLLSRHRPARDLPAGRFQPTPADRHGGIAPGMEIRRDVFRIYSRCAKRGTFSRKIINRKVGSAILPDFSS